MASNNCATGNCKPCTMVKLGDVIDPSSRAHIERNACNRCQSSPPQPQFETVRVPVSGRSKRYHRDGFIEKTVFTHFEDSEKNIWEPDNSITAWWFHNDPFPGFRNEQNMTFRIRPIHGGPRGWQCRYENGVLDDVTLAMGTYDYAEAGGTDHVNMDVSPHNANPNYKPNLTKQFGPTPENARKMQSVFSERREKVDMQAKAMEKLQKDEESKWQSYVDHILENGSIPNM